MPARCTGIHSGEDHALRGGLAGPPAPSAPLPGGIQGCATDALPGGRKAAELLSLLWAEGPRRLTDLIRCSGSRSEATATFLALLELCREGKIHLAGEMDNPEVSWRSGT
ncbi:MAG: hypothetical protein ACLSTT_03500 [Evtepia gabavorous]